MPANSIQRGLEIKPGDTHNQDDSSIPIGALNRKFPNQVTSSHNTTLMLCEISADSLRHDATHQQVEGPGQERGEFDEARPQVVQQPHQHLHARLERVLLEPAHVADARQVALQDLQVDWTKAQICIDLDLPRAS